MNRDILLNTADSPSLAEAFSGKFRVGAAVNTWNLRPDTPEYALIRRQFNVFTLENESKPESLQPEEGVFRFDRFDRFAAFGAETGAALRGHTLVWHGQCPDWFFTAPGSTDGEPASRDLLLERMNTHIRTVVSRYRGKIRTWDVVNEVIRDEGGMRESKWYRIAGTDYIKEAFRTAHEADPHARLIINDYNLESSPAKAETMYRFVKEMLLEGVPVHGIGLQMHLGPDTDMALLRKNTLLLASLREFAPDFRLEMTELDLSCYRWGDTTEDIEQTPEFEAWFAGMYKELFSFYLELADAGILDTVVFWGLHDGASWLNGFPRRHKNYPLLIDRSFHAKPAYFEVLSLAE